MSKMVKYPLDKSEKPIIERIFNLKYPYEYLADDRTDDICRQYEEFYKKNYNF